MVCHNKNFKCDFLYGSFFLFPRHFFEIKVLVSLQSNRRRCVMNVYVTAISYAGPIPSDYAHVLMIAKVCGLTSIDNAFL